MAVVLVAIVVIVVLAVIVLLVRRREPDTLDSFRRQIDALSPEARRPVVDQVQQIEEGETSADDSDEPARAGDGPDDAGGDDPSDGPADDPKGRGDGT